MFKKLSFYIMMILACFVLIDLQDASAQSLDSAYLYVYARNASGETVTVHEITSPWIEDEVTWSSFAGGYDPAIAASHIVDATGWHIIDVTGIVHGWLQGGANHGILLEQDGTQYSPMTVYNSREATSNMPYLELTFTSSDGTTVEQVLPEADAYIWQHYPSYNGGLSPRLYTGWYSATLLDKQTLIRFDIGEPAVPRTPGYWKNHSAYGPAPYDATWAMLPNGEQTLFFLSDKSYYEVLWTKSKKGNAYYILSRAYIAAELNVLNGTTMCQDVQDAFDAANTLFESHTPADIGKLKGKNPLRQEFLDHARILDDYNNGLIP